jgi:hypothetical protein
MTTNFQEAISWVSGGLRLHIQFDEANSARGTFSAQTIGLREPRYLPSWLAISRSFSLREVS